MHLCIYLHIFSSIFNFYFYFQSGKAWFCTILSAFGVVILSVIAHLFNINHEGFVGSINQPEDGPAYVLNKKKSVIKRYEPLIEFNSYSCLLFFFYTNQLLYHFVSFWRLGDTWLKGQTQTIIVDFQPPRQYNRNVSCLLIP